jgi:hypothetical protein
MPVHDWSRVDASIFHDFDLGWIAHLKKALNCGGLPPNFHGLSEQVFGGSDDYASRAVAIHHTSDHRLVAVVEVVSPGDKKTRRSLGAFVGKAVELLRAGIHLLILDLFPPGPNDGEDIHGALWTELTNNKLILVPGKPLSGVSYVGGQALEGFFQHLALGAALPEMPLFLARDAYVPVALEATYQSAWEDVPAFWRHVLTRGLPPDAGGS